MALNFPPRRWHTLVLLVASLFPPLALCAGAGTCYYPNGKVAADDLPCNPNSDVSPCCGNGLGWVCMENGLCLAPQGNTIRGSCTDKNWGEGCTRFCLGENLGGTDLISCENSTGIDTSYCCDHQNGPCCENGVGRFNVLPPHPSTSATYNNQASRYDVLPQSLKPSPTPTSPSSAAGPKASDRDGQSSADQSGPAATAGTAQPTDKSSEGLSSSASAGIGVGVGLGVSALAVISYLLWRRHRKNKASRDFAQGSPSGPYGVASGMPQQQAVAEYYKPQPQPQWQTSPPQEMPSSTYVHELGPSQGPR
ncbi:hypothetical protein PG985_001382 [Apiospora marii]|uniref:uncharacterized protein n=1 Tax=Apiospora marii TaxID=335849 RepID=UPI00312D6712